MSKGEFSVYQFFEDGTYERVRQFVDAEEASKAAQHYCTSVAVRMGIVKRVIITNGGDETCFEWKVNEGIVFPTKGEVMSNKAEDAITELFTAVLDSIDNVSKDALKNDRAIFSVVEIVAARVADLHARVNDLEKQLLEITKINEKIQ